MLKHPRLAFLGGLAGLAVLCVILSVISPIRISIAFERDDQAAAAMPRLDITATAPPPQPTARPTARPQSPTSTPAPTTPPAPTSAPPAEPTMTPRPQEPTAPPRRTTDEPTPIPAEPPAVPPELPTVPPELPNVTIEKTADRATVQPGGRVVFTLIVRNTGMTTARDVVVTDVVPDAFKVVDLSSSKGDVVVDGQTVTAYPALLAPGEMVTLRIAAEVRQDAQPGQHRNTALTTTSTPGDDPGDNTSTVIVTVQPPPAAPRQAAPPQLPRTADPDAPTFMMIWGPWLMFSFIVVVLGLMVRFGMLRTRFVSISLTPARERGSAPLAARVETTGATLAVEGVDLDVAAVVQRWMDGTPVAALTREIAAANPAVNSLMISLAVQKIIDQHMRRG
jgi:uncharacterized repeat protein (TIGR01451 family)